MLTSVLLHLNGDADGTSVISCGVELARRSDARVRGLTTVDTRRLAALATSCEAAGYSSGEMRRLDLVERLQDKVRRQLSQSCLSAGVNFDVRRARGDLLELLPSESQFHDLVVTSCARPGAGEGDGGMEPDELLELLFRGVQPLLVLRGAERPLNRVLLAYDGSPAAGRAVRSFLQQDLLPAADCRLLAIGETEEKAREYLREMSEYCRGRRASIELGLLDGPVRRALAPYALKWEADLIVLGVARGNALLRRWLGEPARDLLRKTDIALYVTA